MQLPHTDTQICNGYIVGVPLLLNYLYKADGIKAIISLILTVLFIDLSKVHHVTKNTVNSA